MRVSAAMPPYIMPSLSRMMVFIDGENIVLRYQDMCKNGYQPREEVQYKEDIFAWHPQAVRPYLHHVIRATYYTSAAGDEPKLEEINEEIRNLKYGQYSIYSTSDLASELGNTLSSVAYKKSKRSVKSKGVDIQMTVDILVNCYRNNLDTVYLVTGDGDFVPVLDEAKRLGKRVYVAAFSKGLNPKLRAVADRFVDLDRIFFLI